MKRCMERVERNSDLLCLKNANSQKITVTFPFPILRRHCNSQGSLFEGLNKTVKTGQKVSSF